MMRTIAANGHRFDSDLVCRAEGCSRTWSEQQVSPTRCGGEPAVPYPKPAKRQTQNPFSIATWPALPPAEVIRAIHGRKWEV